MENKKRNVEEVLCILNKGVELKRYSYGTALNFNEIREDIKISFGIPNEKQVFFKKDRCQNSQTLDALFKESDSDIIEVSLAVKHSIGDFTKDYKIDPQLLKPFNVIFDFPETVVCKDLSLSLFAITIDIKRKIEKDYCIPIASQVLLCNGKELPNLYDLRELYFDIDEETFVNEITIHLKVDAENCKMSTKFVTHATEHNLTSISIISLTNQFHINLAKEDIWDVSDIKKYLEKKNKIRIEAQKLMHEGKELPLNTWLPSLIRKSMEKQVTLTLFVHKIPDEFKTFDFRQTSFSKLLTTGNQMVVLNATETVRTLKERISNATGIHQCFIKVYDGDILYEDDRLLFEIKGSDINFRLEMSVSVHIVDENGVVHQSKHLVNEYDKTVEDMRKDLDESKRFTKGRQYLKFLVNEG